MKAGLQHAAEHLQRFYDRIGEHAVIPRVSAEEVRSALEQRFDFQQPEALEPLVDEVAGLLSKWTVHVTHPRYFGLFNPSVSEASVVADALVAGFNPQLAVWEHSPAPIEIERHTLRHLMRLFGWEPDQATAHFTTGGAEANLTAVATALTQHFPRFGVDGMQSLDGQPTLYVSNETHHSFLKAAHLTGLGRRAVREVESDASGRLNPEALEARIESDSARGCLPFLVVGTAGSTGWGTIDDLPALAGICRRRGLWFHVDAAWGGMAVVSPRLRPHLDGVEAADSITCDAHKGFSVPMGAGMYFSKHEAPLHQAFGVEATYVYDAPEGMADPYRSTMQWSRRFIGLKLFMTLATKGAEGIAAQIEHQAAIAERLREKIRARQDRGWRLRKPTPLPLVCFSHEALERKPDEFAGVLERLYDRGRAWVSEINEPDAPPAFRACITSFRTQPEDLDILLEELERALSLVMA